MASEPIVLQLKEHETRPTDELTADQARLLQVKYSKFLTVRPSWEQGKMDLTAGNHIGTISTDGLRIHIQPKTPIRNLFYMLTYAYELAKFREGETELAVGQDLFEFLVTIFVRQVDQLIRQGIYRGYIDFEESRPFLRGRLLLAEQLQRNAVQVTRFEQRMNELTADLRENRILKYTLWQLARTGIGERNLRLQLRRTFSAFSEVSLKAMGPGDCDRVVYTRLNGSYQTPINLARLFLQHLSLEGHAGETPFMTYLMPMHRVFELFVARFLAEYFADHPNYSIDIQPQIWLDIAQRETGIPDIVLERNGRPYMILDTKYKKFGGTPDEADRNQMFMYCHAMGVRQALLIYSDEEGFNYDRQFRGMKLMARPLALDGELADFQERCRAFAKGFSEKVESEFSYGISDSDSR